MSELDRLGGEMLGGRPSEMGDELLLVASDAAEESGGRGDLMCYELPAEDWCRLEGFKERFTYKTYKTPWETFRAAALVITPGKDRK